MPWILSAASALPFLILIVWMTLKRRFLIYLLLFVLIAFAWRLASGIYIDTSGPVFADQLFRTIGGGTSSLILVATQVVTLLAVLFAFSPARLRRLAGAQVEAKPFMLSLSNASLRKFALWGVLLFLVLLVADLVRGGVIPLFAGIEEYVFNRQCAGRLHTLLLRYGDFLSFYLGLFYANRLLLGGKPDRRFLILFLGVLVYGLLANNRFSVFYRFTTFFLMPLAAVIFLRDFRARTQFAGAVAGSRQGRPYLWDGILVAGAAVALVSVGVYLSLYFPVRSSCGVGPSVVVASGGGVRGYLQQRVLIQQSELWWVTYERIFLRDEFEPERSFTRVFVDPVLDPRRNSTVPYLMERAIGDRAYKVLQGGSQYTGGFPEIFFELFGKVMAFPAIVLMSAVTGWLLYMLVESVLLQRAVRTFLVFYVLYAFLLLPVTGMLNFLVNWKFWLKVAVLVAWLILEQRTRTVPALRRMPASTTS